MSARESDAASSAVDDGEDGATIEPIAQARANAYIFMPAVAVAVLYGGSWAMLWLLGHSGNLIAQIIFVLFVLAPPLLVARAFLKYYSVGLALTEEDILIAPGWPHQTGIEVAITAVDMIEMKRGPLAGIFGAADVRIRLKDDTIIKVPDLDRPDRIVHIIAARIDQTTPSD